MVRSLFKRLPLKTIALLAIAGMAFVYHQGTYKYIESMFPLEKSHNQEASKEFLKAMTYRTYIFHLHRVFDYDSVVMKPFMYMKEFHYEKGRELLPKDSVEDIFWWTLMNKEIYGLVVPKRKDDSMSYAKLPWQEYKKVQEEIFQKLVRYAQGEIYFDAKEIIENRFDMMAVLVQEYYLRASYAYPGNTLLEKATSKYRDIKYGNKLKTVLKIYKDFSSKFLRQSNHLKIKQYSYLEDIVLMSRNIVMNNIMGRGIKFTASSCMTNEIATIVDNLPKLTSYVQQHNNHLSKVIMKDCLYLDSILMREVIRKRVLQYCQSLYPQMKETYQKIEELNDGYK